MNTADCIIHSIPMKTCTKCRETKPETAFHARYPSCKVCKYRQQKAYNAANRLKKRAYNQAYYAATREKQLADKKAYRLANLDKERAQDRRYNATHKEQKHAYNTAYHAANRDKLIASGKSYYAANRETSLAISKAWREANPEKPRLITKAWREANPERVLANNARRRARKRAAPRNDLTAAQWRAIKDHYGHCCVYCGRHMQRLTMDHMVPISKGGAHTLQNVVPACQSCNSRKNDGPVLKPVQPLLLL